MKTSNLSRITLLCGLALGILVFWAAASPIAEGAGLIIGGDWYPAEEGVCCIDINLDECPNGYFPPWHPLHNYRMGCLGDGVYVCEVPDYYSSKGCWGDDEGPVCDPGPPYYSDLCSIEKAFCY